MDKSPIVKQATKEKLKQFLSVAVAFTTTLSLSGFALMFAFTASAQVMTLVDGDVVKTADNPDVYIVTMSPHGQYQGWKRLILNPAVFNLYGHLSWSNIKTVNQATLDAYQTSALVKGENDPKVYELRPTDDTGTRHHITSEAVFLAKGYMWSQIAQVNNKERDMYVEGAAVTDTVTPTPVGTGLTVSLASDTPAAGSVVIDSTTGQGAQAMASMLKLNLTAGNDGDVTVTTVKLKRLGISADSDLANVYLYDGNTRLAEMTNIASTYVTFTNSAGLFTVSKGSTKSITVKTDFTDNVAAGKTIALSVNAASDVVAGTANVSGTFPISGSYMTTAQVSDLGRLTFPSTMTAPSSVDPGQTGIEVAKLYLLASDQKIKVSYLKFTNVGTIAATDLANLKLMDGTTQLGSTAANISSDGTVTFDMSSAPLVITAGQQKNLSLVADVIGGTAREFKFTIQRAADVIAMDNNYGVFVKPGGSGTFAVQQPAAATSVSTGTLTISVDAASPTGNIAAGYTDQEFARFTFKAAGEAVKITSLTATSTNKNSSGTTVYGAGVAGVNDAKMYLDGTQIGTTADLASGAGATFTFGNSFIVPAGATKTLVIKGDVKSENGTALSANTTVQISLVAGSANAQRQVSLGTFGTTAANGNTLTVQTGSMSFATNAGMANATTALPTGVKGASNVKIGSFVFTAGAGEAVEVTQMVFTGSSNAALALGQDFQNLKAMNGSTQIGTTVGSLSTSASQTYTFTPATGITINAGQQYVVDVYADILTGASNAYAVSSGTVHTPITLTSVTATGKSTATSAGNSSLTVAGQSVFIATAGSLTVAAASDMPIAQNRSMGETGQTLATFKLTTGPAESVSITKIEVTDTLSGTASAATGTVINLKLFKSDGTQVGTTVASMEASGGMDVKAVFSGLTLSIGKDKSEILTLKGDVNGYPNAISGSAHTFSITAAGAVTAIGTQSSGSITPTLSAPTGTAQRAYRAELTVTNAMSSFSGGKGTDQNIGKFRFTNTSAGNYSITVSDIDLGISSTITKSNSATRYVTLKRDSVGGTTVAKKAYAYAATAFSDATDLTTLTTAYDASNDDFNSFTIDAASGTGYVDIYVLIDTNDAAVSTSVATGIGQGTNVVTWSDGVSSNITSLDNKPIIGATVTY